LKGHNCNATNSKRTLINYVVHFGRVICDIVIFNLGHIIAQTIVTVTDEGILQSKKFTGSQQFLSWKGMQNPTCE
jgi:hypothetical protein